MLALFLAIGLLDFIAESGIFGIKLITELLDLLVLALLFCRLLNTGTGTGVGCIFFLLLVFPAERIQFGHTAFFLFLFFVLLVRRLLLGLRETDSGGCGADAQFDCDEKGTQPMAG